VFRSSWKVPLFLGQTHKKFKAYVSGTVHGFSGVTSVLHRVCSSRSSFAETNTIESTWPASVFTTGLGVNGLSTSAVCGRVPFRQGGQVQEVPRLRCLVST